MTSLGAVLVIAKQPLPGRVKTRLCPPYTYEQAADLAACALADTLRAAERVPAARHILVFDGDPHGIVPAGWQCVAQVAGALDRRLVGAFAAAGPGPAVLVGMDTPQLRPEHVTAFDPARYDACLGRAGDGGYWAIGFARPRQAAATIAGVPMSQPTTAALQLERLLSAGLRVQLLDVLTDVDTAEAARTVAESAPATEFADAYRGMEFDRAAARR